MVHVYGALKLIENKSLNTDMEKKITEQDPKKQRNLFTVKVGSEFKLGEHSVNKRKDRSEKEPGVF